VDAIAGLVALMDEARLVAGRLRVPLLVLVGERDEVVPPRAQESFTAMLGATDCQLVRYPEGWHMLLRDLQRAVVWRDIEAWMAGGALPSGLTQECRSRQVASLRSGQPDWRRR
jgi:alpha-beta hydrolase superfamily lysophospholipase